MISRKSRESRVAELAAQVHLAWFVCLLALLGLLFGGATTRSNRSKVFVAGHGPAALDDFDGDFAPDSASIRPIASNSPGVYRVVQLQFSSGKRRSIRLVGRSGDVRIVARDVNGDRSAWTEEPCAVLINDGSGAFSPVDPSFPQALSRKSKRSLSWPRQQPPATAATSPSSGEWGFAKTKCTGHIRSTKRLVYLSKSILVRCPLLVSLPGHARPRPLCSKTGTASHKTGGCELYSA